MHARITSNDNTSVWVTELSQALLRSWPTVMAIPQTHRSAPPHRHKCVTHCGETPWKHVDSKVERKKKKKKRCSDSKTDFSFNTWLLSKPRHTRVLWWDSESSLMWRCEMINCERRVQVQGRGRHCSAHTRQWMWCKWNNSKEWHLQFFALWFYSMCGCP